jgi:hypothetical protein
VRLPDDDVHVLVLRDCYQLQLHGFTSTCIVAPEVQEPTAPCIHTSEYGIISYRTRIGG